MKRKSPSLIGFLFFFLAFLIFHLAANAQIMFQNEFVRTNLYETKQTPDSGYISVGWWNGGTRQSACLVKTNSFGETIWTRMYGQSKDVIAFSTEMTSDGGYILNGSTYSGKVYLIKTDSNGDTLWTKNLGGVGSGFDSGREVHQTLDGGYILTGGTGNFGTGIYVIKTDSIGDVEWSRVFKNIKEDDISYSICQTADSGFVASGVLKIEHDNSDIVLIKMNSFGDTLWTKSYGGPGQDFANCIQQTFNHGLVIGGYSNSFDSGGDALLLITDSIGNLILSKTYSGTGFIHGFSVSQTADSGYVLSGNTNSFGVATWAPFVLKVNSVGDVLWAKAYADFQYGVAWSIKQTNDGGYVTAGAQHEMMKLNSNGSSGCLELDATPVVTNLPITHINNPINVTVANTLNFPAYTEVISGIDIVNICFSVGLNEISKSESPLQVFPNPASESLIITLPEFVNKGVIKFYNLVGEIILEENIFQVLNKEINLQNMTKGIYFIKVFNGEKTYSTKLIVEDD